MAQQRASAIASAARHVEQIVEAAERAAEELRAEAEERADERIAEAERAAQMRVQAADDEAEEVRAEAAEAAREAHDKAMLQAREIVSEARQATREVLRDGEALSGRLRELSNALRTNAERLLRDVHAAHDEMTARLDRADPDLTTSRSRTTHMPGTADEPDVPDFLRRRPR